MSGKRKVLLVDDEKDIREKVARFLQGRGFGVITARDGSDAFAMAQETAPDVVVSDANMPGMDGMQLCRLLKKGARTRTIPVILMSGVWVDEKDQLSGFSGGADDYVVKPFSLRVLLARIEAVLRRFQAGSAPEDEVIESCGIKVDAGARTVSVRGKEVRLTRKEFDLLAVFLRRPGRVLKTGYLLETVWGYDPADYNDPHTIEVHLSSLRRKLGPAAAKRIVSVKGVGYRFDGDPSGVGGSR